MAETTLKQLYASHEGKVSDKWSGYLDEYERLFGPLKNKQLSLLEIGVQNGGSLEIWAQFFPYATALIGCDIDENCAKLKFADSRISIVIGDASAPATRDSIIEKAPAFDIVIDDGSHHAKDIVRSFANYFPLLVDDGVYLAEDLHCSYWQAYGGGLYQPYSPMAFFKRLADVINHEHWGVEKTREQILRGFKQEFACHFDAETLSQIHSIEFLNSICVVRKSHQSRNVLGHRVVAGTLEDVKSGGRELDGRMYADHSASDETANVWSMRDAAPNESVLQLESSLAASQLRIEALEGELASLQSTLEAARSEAIELNDQIDEIKTSTSWRITRPLRSLKRTVYKAKQVGLRTHQMPKR